MYNFLFQNVLIFPIYMLFPKRIVFVVLGHFESKIYEDFLTIPSVHMLNCFKHFLK